MLKSETSYHVTVLTALCHVNELSSSQKIERRAGTLNGDCHEMHALAVTAAGTAVRAARHCVASQAQHSLINSRSQ